MLTLFVGQMFLAGILPGVMIGACLIVAVAIIVQRRNFESSPRTGLRAVASTGAQAIVALVIPVIIVGASTLFAWIVADLRLSRAVGQAIFSISDNPVVFLLLVSLFALVIGLTTPPVGCLI